jgi:hypothetical protein
MAQRHKNNALVTGTHYLATSLNQPIERRFDARKSIIRYQHFLQDKKASLSEADFRVWFASKKGQLKRIALLIEKMRESQKYKYCRCIECLNEMGEEAPADYWQKSINGYLGLCFPCAKKRMF